MKRNLFLIFILLSPLALLLPRAGAQSAYFQAVTNLNPVGYWPMHEVAAPATGNIETNYGTLGLLGTGYYPDWLGGPSLIQRGATGALAGDSNKAVYFAEPSSNTGGTSNSLYVPHSSRSSTLVPPFSVECWFYPTNNNQGDIWSQSGFEGLNAGASGGGAGAVSGIRLYWNGPGFTVYSYHNSSTLNQLGSASSFAFGQWYHVVVTSDSDTNISLTVNGNLMFSKAATSLFASDYWTPFEVGNGRGNSRAVKGIVDEVALYTNVLADIGAHYSAGTNTSPSPTYFQLVTNDNPIIYFRMDGPAYSVPPSGTWPVLTNFGSAGANGVYTPGTIPGLLPGPTSSNGVAFNGLGGVNVAQLGGVSSFADVGNAAVYNPTGLQPFSLIAMFRGNPCDNRFQNIVGHSDSSWRLAMNINGKLQATLGSNGTSVVNSAGIYNDGNWHQAVLIYAPGSGPTVTGTNALFVDGVLDAAVTTVTTNGILPGSALNMLIGADPQYTNNPAGVGRQFSGQVCEVAWFTNSLSSNNVQALFNAAGVFPYFKQQPVSASANEGSPFTNTVVVVGSAPLSYQWYEDGLPRNNQTNASLILNSVRASDASTNWYVTVANSAGSVTSAVVSLSVSIAPAITQQPAATNIVLFTGGHATLSITASGASPLSFQWASNNVPISGATNTSYSLANVQLGSPVNYYCTVTNVAGVVTSAVVSVAVVSAPTATYPATVLADGPLDYFRLDEGPDDGAGNSGVAAYDYWGGNNCVYTNVVLVTQGYSTNDPDTASRYGTVNTNFSFAGFAQGINLAQPTNQDGAITVEAWVNPVANGNGFAQTAGAGIVCLGYGGGGEQFALDCGGTSNSFRFFFRDAGGASHTANANVPSADGNWHHLVGVLDGANRAEYLWVDGQLAQLTTLAATGLGVQAENQPTNRFTIGWRNGSTVNPFGSSFQFQGTVDEVSIYNYALSSNQVQAHYLSAGIPPRFTLLATNITVSEGTTATFTAAAYGSGTISYQWWNSGGSTPTTILPGQTSSTLTLANVTAAMSGNFYQLVVSNAYGSATSPSVQLTVISGPPVIVQDLPATVTTAAGHTYIYSVQTQGSQPFYYYWYKGASLISGQTSSTYAFSAAPGSYSVVVSNAYNTANSTISVMTTVATPSNSYANTLLGFGPVGYWPLQEANPPAPMAMETNLGSLGKLGNAYYAINVPSQPNVTFGQGGALTGSGDNDTSVQFAGPSATNYLFVPRISPALTTQAPFTWELWLNSSSTAFGDIMSEGGSGLNSAPGSGIFTGFRLSWGGNNGGGPNFQAYVYNGTGGTGAYNSVGTPAGSTPFGTWHHCVATYDGTTLLLYVDGQQKATATLPLAINLSSPLVIGDGRWQGDGGTTGPTRSYNGLLDEVAVYTNVLSATSISNHYLAGVTSGSNYVQTVQSDNPLLYYRMDCAGFPTPNPGTYPTAVNFGSAPVNGTYQPGTVPSGVSGPPIPAWSPSIAASPINGILSCVDAGSDASFNPTGTHPFTAMTWLRAYPGDGRVQTIMGHGANNWALNLDGTTGFVVWNTYSAGSVTSSNILNDGNWYFLAGVYDGATNYLYVNGALNGVAQAGITGVTGETTDLFLGGDSDYVIVGSNQRYLGGAMAQAAFFTNALTAAQIQQIYSAANPVAPTISLSRAGTQLVINYTGTLVSSTNLNGTYSVVPGASTPYMFTPVPGTRLFYRARIP